jgi:hypothetical protein
VLPFDLGHAKELRNELTPAREESESRRLLVLPNVPALETTRAVHGQEPSRHPAEHADRKPDSPKDRFANPSRTLAESIEHPPNASPVFPFLDRDRGDLRRFVRSRERPRMAFVRQSRRELAGVSPFQNRRERCGRSFAHSTSRGPHCSKKTSLAQRFLIHWYIYMRTPTSDDVLLGRGDRILLQSFDVLRRHVDAPLETRSPRLAFMTDDHHRVRDYAVTELPRFGRALSPEHIARGTGIPLDRVETILGELERERFFLVRDPAGRVSWAFPVTSEETPHRLRLSTGDTIYAA